MYNVAKLQHLTDKRKLDTLSNYDVPNEQVKQI